MSLPYYRQTLLEHLSERTSRNRNYSLRSFARALGIEASTLSQVLSGKRFLSIEKAAEVTGKLGLSPDEQQAFKVSLAQAKKQAGHKRFTSEMKQALTPRQNEVVPSRELSLDAFRIVADWHHFAILVLTQVRGFRSDPEWIAQQLGIPLADVLLGIDRLKSLELLREEDGRLVRASGRIESADKSLTTAAHRRRQKQILEKSIASLDRDPIEKRNHTAMTLAIDEKKLPEAKKRIQSFMNDMTEFLETGTQTRVYEMIVNLIPLQKENP